MGRVLIKDRNGGGSESNLQAFIIPTSNIFNKNYSVKNAKFIDAFAGGGSSANIDRVTITVTVINSSGAETVIYNQSMSSLGSNGTGILACQANIPEDTVTVNINFYNTLAKGRKNAITIFAESVEEQI